MTESEREIKIIDGVAYIKASVQPKNKVQAEFANYQYWSNPQVTKHNCTGKTTATLLQLIAHSMLNPNKEIKIKDFIGQYVLKHTFSDLNKLIENSGLKFLRTNEQKQTIIYEIFHD